MIKIDMPAGAAEIVLTLQKAGFEAYIVGGCVRDSLLGRVPKDWDICTSAKPDEIIRCFPGKRIIETGLKHGTVTVVIGDEQFEVTTFRVDGVYSDGRRPDSVAFVTDVVQDLARRDFTMNAIAYNDQVGLVDPFGGLQDIVDARIRCVGRADERFQEDGLRLMRALRFASVYCFDIEESTKAAIHRNVGLLRNIAAERITVELSKMVCGAGVPEVLLEYKDVLSFVIPELGPCVGFDQNNKYHCYTVYDHIAVAVSNYEGDDVVVKMALLLHDIGKPHCYTEDHNGGHFHGHGIISRELAEQALGRLRFGNKTRDSILELVLYHDSIIEPTRRTVRRWLNKIGPEQLARLLDVRAADILAHSPNTQSSRMERRERLLEILAQELEAESCFTLKDLAIGGKDVMALGVPEGKQVGFILNKLLAAVINDEVENEREALLTCARQLSCNDA